MIANIATRACRSRRLQGLDPNARVIYIGTFSKVLFPSLRLGYLVIPSDLVDRFLTIRRAMDLGPPTFYQEVLADFFGEGTFCAPYSKDADSLPRAKKRAGKKHSRGTRVRHSKYWQ